MDSYEDAAKDLLGKVSQYYTEKDTDALCGIVAEDFSGFGAGAGDVLVGKEGYRRQIEQEFSRAEAISAAFAGLRIKGQGDMAWFMASCIIFARTGDGNETSAGRMTGLIRRNGDGWEFVQLHFSLPSGVQVSPAL